MIITIIIILVLLGFVLLAVLTFARDLLVTILGGIIGLFKKGSKDKGNDSGRQTIRRRDRRKQKVVDDSEGEYVDFEEIKK